MAILSAAATDRAALWSAYDRYADVLQSVRTATLATQEGMTAESAHHSFRVGELRARDISARNLAKQAAYASAHQSVTDLRTELEVIAASGNAEIRRILDSDDPAAVKISALVHTVTEAQQHANSRAAACCATLCDAIQTVLTAGDADTSARELARSHGVELARAFSAPNTELIQAAVSAMMSAPSGASGASGAAVAVPGVAVPGVAVPEVASTTSTPASQSLAQSFTDGTNAGAPLAVGTAALAAGAVNAIHPAESDSAAEPLTDSSASAAVTPMAETTSTVASPGVTAPPTVPAAEPNQTAIAPTPLPPVSAAAATAAPATAPGLLPRYGTDLASPVTARPPTPTFSAPAAPASAPVTATPVLAHSSMVRQQPAAPVANAVVANTVGALAGSGAARSAAQSRLRRLLESVVRQEPKLRWAIGDRRDGSTILITDLASGWIPPHIDIPVGVQLLEPGRRSGDLVTLLGETMVMATYEPGHDTVCPELGETVPKSVRARYTSAVDDLGWALIQATRWRAGLPRLAHTVTRATVARTGYLDSEIASLRDELHAVADAVLDGYPESVKATDVGTWQLLAAVQSLINNERSLAGYHVAWFTAQTALCDPEESR